MSKAERQGRQRRDAERVRVQHEGLREQIERARHLSPAAQDELAAVMRKAIDATGRP